MSDNSIDLNICHLQFPGHVADHLWLISNVQKACTNCLLTLPHYHYIHERQTLTWTSMLKSSFKFGKWIWTEERRLKVLILGIFTLHLHFLHIFCQKCHVLEGLFLVQSSEGAQIQNKSNPKTKFTIWTVVLCDKLGGSRRKTTFMPETKSAQKNSIP